MRHRAALRACPSSSFHPPQCRHTPCIHLLGLLRLADAARNCHRIFVFLTASPPEAPEAAAAAVVFMSSFGGVYIKPNNSSNRLMRHHTPSPCDLPDTSRRFALRASRKQMSAWSVKTRRAPSRHCTDAGVYGRTTTAMHEIEYTPPCPPPPTRPA